MNGQPIDLLAALHAIRSAIPYLVMIPAFAAGAWYVMLGISSARRDRASTDAWRRINETRRMG